MFIGMIFQRALARHELLKEKTEYRLASALPITLPKRTVRYPACPRKLRNPPPDPNSLLCRSSEWQRREGSLLNHMDPADYLCRCRRVEIAFRLLGRGLIL